VAIAHADAVGSTITGDGSLAWKVYVIGGYDESKLRGFSGSEGTNYPQLSSHPFLHRDASF
jgi:hypothetical protein